MNTRRLLMALTIVLCVGVAGRARAIIPFSTTNLNGTYLLQATGSTWDDNVPPDQGELALTGIISFDGSGGVEDPTNVRATYMDTAGDAVNCILDLDTSGGSTYTVASDGTGTMTLDVEAPGCLAPNTDQDMDFDIVVSGPVNGASKRAQIIGAGFSDDLEDDNNDDITTLQFQGTLVKR